MLFYASEKYPLEDDYSKYITEVLTVFNLSSMLNCISMQKTGTYFLFLNVNLFYWKFHLGQVLLPLIAPSSYISYKMGCVVVKFKLLWCIFLV